MTRLPAGAQPVLFAILTTGFASFMVAAIATARAIGAGPGFFHAWIAGWLWSWPVAATAMYCVAPGIRRFLARICDKP